MIATDAPRVSPAGEVFFRDSDAKEVVGPPDSLAQLNLTAGTISGLTLGSGESLQTNGGIVVLSSPAPGQYLTLVKISGSTGGGSALVSGPPGAFTKILRTGDPLPGTSAVWTPTRYSPTFYVQPDLPTTRGGDPMIKAATADDSQAYISVYRDGAWENTQVVGITPPGFGAGDSMKLDAINVRAGNSVGQFTFDTTIYPLTTPFTQAAFLGGNGSLQLIAKTGDVLPGDPRPVMGNFRPGSVNDSGTVALAGLYIGVEGYVYRWSAAGGATKVISQGDPIPSIGPRAIFKGPNTFQNPLINAAGAVLFVGDVLVGGTDSDVARGALLYQSAPGAPVVKVAMHGDAIAGLPDGTVAYFDNTDNVNFNDAGQIALVCHTASNTKAGGRPGEYSLLIAGGTAPNISVLVREDTPAPIEGLVGSKTFKTLTKPLPLPGSASSTFAGEIGAILSAQGEIVFRGVLPGGFFGNSAVFEARLNVPQTSPLAVQTIDFPQPFSRAATPGTLTLAATSSSGLPVAYSLVSGPATLSGNILSFTGSEGDVLVRATQAGNASFLAAETIDRTIQIKADATLLPPPGSALVTPILLPRFPGPGTVYSGIETTAPLVFPEGTIDSKDATTNDVITTGSASVRLDVSAATIAGLTAAPGEILNASRATVLGVPSPDRIFVKVPFKTADGSNPTNQVIAVGIPGNFTKILQTGDLLPGTTSVYGSTSLPDTSPPQSTRGGLPLVLASAPDGQSSHVGIYRNGTWETTQIIGATPPGSPAGSKFLVPFITAANSAGGFIFKSTPVKDLTYESQGIFYGINNNLIRIARQDVDSQLPGDSRKYLSIDCKSLNAGGEGIFHGIYRAVSGNSDQGGFVSRWSAGGGFSSVLKRGDSLSEIGPAVVFDSAVRAPIINDSGAIVILAKVADLNSGTGAISNRKLALLYQANAGAPILKLAITGENVAGSPANYGNFLAGYTSGPTFYLNGGPPSIQLNNSGQIAVFSLVSGSSVVYGGTLPDFGFIMKSNWVDIAHVGTRSILFDSPNTYYDSLDGVTGDPNARLSDAGEFVFRGRYSGIGVGNFDTGVFKAAVNPPATIPVAQTITFPVPADRLIDSAAFDPAATSVSGLAITYEIMSGPAAVSGSLVTPGATSGLVTIRATQTGNASYLAAPPVERSFRVVANASELAMTDYLAAAGVPPASRLAMLDLDHDGLTNLLEFALGGNPLVPDVKILPTAQIIGGVLSFTYTRAHGSSVDYLVKASTDLTSAWTATGVIQGSPDTNGITTATYSLTAGTSGFLRLEVSLAP